MSLRDLFHTPAPDVAVEIDRTHVAESPLAVNRCGQEHAPLRRRQVIRT